MSGEEEEVYEFVDIPLHTFRPTEDVFKPGWQFSFISPFCSSTEKCLTQGSKVSGRLPANRLRSLRWQVNTSAQAEGHNHNTPPKSQSLRSRSMCERCRGCPANHLIMAPSMSQQQGGKQEGEEHSLRERPHSSPVHITATNSPPHTHTHTRGRRNTQAHGLHCDCGDVLFAISASHSPSAGPSEIALHATSAYACIFFEHARVRSHLRTLGCCVSTRSLTAPRWNRDKPWRNKEKQTSSLTLLPFKGPFKPKRSPSCISNASGDLFVGRFAWISQPKTWNATNAEKKWSTGGHAAI